MKAALAKHDDEVDALVRKEDVKLEYPDDKSEEFTVTAGRCATQTGDLDTRLRDKFEEIGRPCDTYRMAENLMWLANMDCVGDESAEFTVKVRTDKLYPATVELTDKLVYVLATQYKRDE